jgi:hypothetical protein
VVEILFMKELYDIDILGVEFRNCSVMVHHHGRSSYRQVELSLRGVVEWSSLGGTTYITTISSLNVSFSSGAAEILASYY